MGLSSTTGGYDQNDMSEEEENERLSAMRKWADDLWISTPKPPKYAIRPEIYHYTGQEALLGIIKHNQIWASHISRLNDKSEYEFGKFAVIEAINNQNVGVSHPAFADALKTFDEGIATYVACYTQEPNLLSQWRAYAGPRQGYCIEFDTRKMIVSGKFPVIEKVSYDTVRVGEIIAILSEASNSLVLSKSTDLSPVEVGYLSGIIRQYFQYLACTIKDSAFEEEKEWRHIYQPAGSLKGFEINSRSGDFGLTPHAELGPGKCGKLPINSITIGPCDDYKLEESMLRLILDKHDYKEVEIKHCNIPLRLS